MKKSMQSTIRTYLSRIKNNNLDFHMLLYSDNHLFEYNPKSGEFRPFNSIKWYCLDEEKFYNIFRYLDSIYELLSSYDNDDINNDIGIIIGNTIAVDLNKAKDNLESSIPNTNGTTFTEMCLRKSIDECENLIDYFLDIYEKWNKVGLFVLNNYEDINELL